MAESFDLLAEIQQLRDEQGQLYAQLKQHGEELADVREQRDSLLEQVVKFQMLLTAAAQAAYNAGFISHIAANEHAALRCDARQKAIHWCTVNNKIETQLKDLLEALKDQGFIPLIQEMPK